MQARWGRTLARTLVVCACIPALATAGAYASTAKEDSDRRELEKAPCAEGPTISGAVPLDTLKACGTSTEVEPAENLGEFTQLGPIILQRSATATAGDYSTSSVPTITTLVPFANFTIPSGSFPADVEILPSDPVHVYELMNTGAVRSYTTAGVAAAVSTVVPPVGETWTDLAVDPTTGTTYALSSNSTCTIAKLFTVNLLAGTSSQVGATTIAGCMVGLLADNSGNLFGHNIAADNLLAIDKATGAATIVGPVGFDGNFGQSADCDPGSGTCYLFAFNATAFRGELRSLNLATGASTLVNPIGSIAPGGTVQISGGVFGTFGICQVNSDCNDNNACNGLETCDTGSGNCIPGTPVVCDDGQQCTLNQCDPGTGSCSFPPNTPSTPATS